jgi:hypothetical protein
MLVAAVVPAVCFKVETTFAGRENPVEAELPMDASFFASFDMWSGSVKFLNTFKPEMTVEKVDKLMLSYSETGVLSFISGETGTTNSEIAKFVFAGFGGADLAWLIALIPTIVMVVALLAAAIIWQNLYAAATGVTPRKAITLPVRITALVASCAVLALAVIVVVVSNHNLSVMPLNNGSASYAIGAGFIMLAAGAIMAMSVPMGKKK